MKREARALPDVMITSAAPALAFLLYFCCWCNIVNNLITSTVRWLLWLPRPTVLTYRSVNTSRPQFEPDFPVTTSFSVIE